MAVPYRLTLIAAIASALLLWAASPAVGAGWVAWVALVPAAAATLASPGTRAARLAIPLAYAIHLELLLVPAFPFGLADGQWGDPLLPVLVAGSPVLAIALVAVPLVCAALYLVRFGEPWGAGRLRGGTAIAAVVVVPALAWTALDFARANLDPAGLWGPLFLSQADEAAGAIAALGGPWLVTFAIVAVNYAIAVALVRRRPRILLAPAAIAAALVVGGGLVEDDGSTAAGVRVAAIQPGYDTAESGRPELRQFTPGSYDRAALDLARDQGELTGEAARAGAELVLWPEASMYADPRAVPPVRDYLARLVEATGVAIVIPFFLPRPVAEGQVLAVEPTAEGARFTDTRRKHRPLWFLGERPADRPLGPLETAGLSLGPLLGTDTLNARFAGRLTAGGAGLLVSATHDWHQSAVPARAYAQLAARATGAPLLRADWRYGSAVYRADGELAADAGGERLRTVVVAEIPLGAGATPYARAGDFVGWAAVAAVGLAVAGWALGFSRAGGRAGGDRAPRRGPPRKRPSRAQPRAADGPKPPPP